MRKIRLVHWNAAEAKVRAAKLRALGYEVSYDLPHPPSFVREIRELEPIAVVIDLSRLPSNGMGVALSLREQKATRHIPLVFVGGLQEKVERVKGLLPDASYASWRGIGGALKAAQSKPMGEPVARARFDAYAGVALAKKLGVKEQKEVRLIGAPEEFDQALNPLPDGATLRRGAPKGGAINLWFVIRASELEKRIDRMVECAEAGGLWIVWPKKSSVMKTDLTQVVVRKIGLAAGLVDYKIASLGPVWSGLRFTRRA